MPYYFLYPYKLKEEDQKVWDNFLSIRGDLFHEANLAVQTSRDSLVIETNKEDLINKFEKIANSSLSTKELIKEQNWDKWKGNDWTEQRIQKYMENLRSGDPIEKHIRKFHYRPFDFQYLFYFDGFVQVPARGRSDHLKSNKSEGLAFVVGRSGRPVPYPWDMALITSVLPDALLVSMRGSSILCPLKHMKKGKLVYNLKLPFLKKFIKNYKLKDLKIENEESPDIAKIGKPIMYYFYAILYSSRYRENWALLLKYDMPRFPFPQDYSLFQEVAQRGEQLAKLHLFENDALSQLDNKLKANFPVSGTNMINTIRYRNENEIKINKDQYFENIPKEIWNFRIGGYQVLKQWLNRRRRTKITNEGIKHFSTVVAILKVTLKFMEEINHPYEQIEENLLEKKRFGISLDDFLNPN
jgi:predicted helicase